MALDEAQELELALAVRAGEGLFFRKIRWGFGHFAEVCPDTKACFFSGSTQEPVVADTAEAFGESV